MSFSSPCASLAFCYQGKQNGRGQRLASPDDNRTSPQGHLAPPGTPQCAITHPEGNQSTLAGVGLQKLQRFDGRDGKHGWQRCAEAIALRAEPLVVNDKTASATKAADGGQRTAHADGQKVDVGDLAHDETTAARIREVCEPLPGGTASAMVHLWQLRGRKGRVDTGVLV